MALGSNERLGGVISGLLTDADGRLVVVGANGAAITGGGGGYGVSVAATGDGTTNDGPAIQAAIDEVAALGGGVVFFPWPTVRYKSLQSLVLPANVPIMLLGEHPNVQIRFPTDLGAGNYAVTHNGAAWNESKVVIRNLHFYGPYTATVIGTAPAAMRGVRCWRNWELDHVKSEGFRSGVYIDGDHGALYDCDLTRNYFNLHFGATPATKGDHIIRDTDLAESYFASLAIAPDNTIEYGSFDHVHFGYAPFCVYREASPSVAMAIYETTFRGCDFEAWGNAIFYDETPGSDMDGVYFYGTGQGNIATDGTFNSTYYYASKPRTYAVRWNNIKRVTIDAGPTLFCEPGGTAVIRTDGYCERIDWRGAQQPIVNAEARNKPIFDIAGAYSRIRMRDGTDEFVVAKSPAATAISRYEPVMTYSYESVERWDGTTPGKKIVGIAAHRVDQNEFLPVQVRGLTYIKSTDATLTYGNAIKPGGAGLVVKATDFSDATVVARCVEPQAAGQVLGVLCTRE